MKRIALTGLVLAAVMAAGVGGYWAGLRGTTAPLGLTGLFGTAPPSKAAQPAPSGPVIYYQDPDGRPVYSPVPRRTYDGREFRAVHASQDVTFEDKPPSTAAATASGRPAAPALLPQPHGPAGHLAHAEEGLDGDGLHSGL